MVSNKQCQSCLREFSVFIRPYSCDLCNQNKLCSNCARKFVLSYEPNPSYLRLCNECCDKVSRGNQLKHPSSKSSKFKGKQVKDNAWSFSSWIGKSSSKKQYTSSSKKAQCIHISSCSSTKSCSNLCSTQKNNKTFAAYTKQLKDQAPLFPEINRSPYASPHRQKKKNIVFRQRMSDEDCDCTDPIDVNATNANDDDANHHSFRTMHPLNNLKIKPPKSILSVQPNRVALNLSINKYETLHLIGNLEKTSLCDCFHSILKKKQNLQITSNQAMDDADAMQYPQDTNTFARCVTIPIIKHKAFKLLRIDLLFDDKEYNYWTGDNCEKYVSINVSLYDHRSHIYSGVQMVKIVDHSSYKIIPRIAVKCNQTLIKKSVTIIGSIAWEISNDSRQQNDAIPNYPYETCSVSEMISLLAQQRLDIIESYDTVLQQRNKIDEHEIASPELQEADEEYKSKLYPVKYIAEEDGGSNIPTKRKPELLPNNHKHEQEGDASLLPAACSSKRNGIKVQQMEKNMLQQEISRIDSMIMGLETILSCVNENESMMQPFDEVTSSITSSFMFNTNELNSVKSKIEQHLTDHTTKRNVPEAMTENPKSNTVENIAANVVSLLPDVFPICLSCQRCSRTIMLTQKTR